MAAFVAIVLAVALSLEGRPAAQASILVPLTVLLLLIAARTTRGGWRWRWGEKD